MSTVVFYIGLGANLGDRAGTLNAAINDLNIMLTQKCGMTHCKVAPWYESAPIGEGANGGAYLNTVVQGELAINNLKKDTPISNEVLIHSARVLLQVLHDIEFQYGRTRERSVRNQARTLDLDLLLFGDLVCDTVDLTVPHPRMHERAFVLKPLSDLTPALAIPLRGSVRGHLAQVMEQELVLIDSGVE